jgi:putative ABC transport system substrate-binding protein
MNRRTFLCGLILGELAKPLAAEAPPAASARRIGFLLVGLTPESTAAQHFRNGLRDAGYAEGRNVVIEWRSAKDDYDRVPG